ncbi:MAG: protein kinase [Anaerolineales bacterium]|nr:protein kinase [Anaerolineales bacterium]
MTNSQQDRYNLQKPLGGGGMGEVWLAHDTLLNRAVAIKYLKGTQDPLYETLFLSEARTLASLNHPNITLIYDAVLAEQRSGYYLVMEYVEGRSLDHLIANWSGPLPLEIILDVAVGVLEALHYAHGKGVVHRDIKPANVMMAPEGVKLTDFGVAGLISLLAQGSEYIVGTPAYMSPEQIDGAGIDGRADLYSLGVMLFELVSGGRLPFEYSKETDVFTAHLQEEPPPLRQVAPHILPALDHVITRLLAKDPQERYPSAAALLEVIKSIQARQKYSQDHLHWLETEGKFFVDRADELNRLETLWLETHKSAQPRLVVVKGPAGIGKSRLIVEFLGRAVVDKGFVVIAGKCAESGVPYSPYAEILATALNKKLVKSATSEQINRLIDQIPGLARLLNIPYDSPPKEAPAPAPAQPNRAGLWQALSTRVSDTFPTVPAQNQWQFFGTVLSILAELGPTVLFLEDAAALDEASLALTRFLIRQEQLPLLLLAACREGDQPLAWLDSFSADELVNLTVPPLPAPAIKEYVAHVLGGSVTEAVVNVLVERSHGQPLHLEEMIHHLIESKEIYQEDGEWRYAPKKLKAPSDAFLPKAVFDAFTRQIESLSESHREALALAALIEPGGQFDFAVWLTLLGGEAQENLAREVLAEATKKRLLRQAGEGRYAFRSTDINKALAANLPEPRRRELHRQLADIMRQQQAEPLLIGHHYQQAGLSAEAAHYLEMAGTAAIAGNALDSALTYFQRAVGLIETSSAYQALGHLYRQTGKRVESVQAFQRALELVEPEDNGAERARILNGLVFTFWLYDYYKEAYQHAASVLRLPQLPDPERATAQTHLTVILWLLGRLNEAETWGHKAVQTALKCGDEARLAEAYYRLGLVYASQGKLADAPIVLQRALGLRRKLQDVGGEADCLKELGKIALERGEFEQGRSFLSSARQLFEQTQQQSGLVAVYTYLGRAALYQNRPDETLALMNKALPPAMELGQRSVHLLSGIYLLIAQASLAVGKVNRAKAAADNGLKLVEAVGNREFVALGRAVLAQVQAAQDDFPGAEVLYQQAMALFEEVGSRPGLVRTQLGYAQFLARQGQTDKAAALEEMARGEAVKIGLHLS